MTLSFKSSFISQFSLHNVGMTQHEVVISFVFINRNLDERSSVRPRKHNEDHLIHRRALSNFVSGGMCENTRILPFSW